jgi:hypothetical protein
MGWLAMALEIDSRFGIFARLVFGGVPQSPTE